VCGTLLADDSEFCPVCAFQQVLGTQTYSVSNSSSELRFEHYTVLQTAEGKPLELGRGAMGVTYKAFDVRLQRPAALKIINPQLRVQRGQVLTSDSVEEPRGFRESLGYNMDNVSNGKDS
jgi:hypothetical protein